MTRGEGMKYSIKTQLIGIFTGLMAIVLLSTWMINNFFMESYYIVKKEKLLIDTYSILSEASLTDDYEGESFGEKVRVSCGENSILLLIVNNQYKKMYRNFYSEGEAGIMAGRLFGYFMGIDTTKSDVLKVGDGYLVQKITDPNTASDYLESWGTLASGDYFMMRIPIESIRESVRISNEFLAYISIFVMLLCALVIWWLSKKIAKPLSELTDLSKKMADLDFDAKYTSGGKNEIGQLGENFNMMSEVLEKTFSELKTANNELQNDIEKKIQIDEMRKDFLSNVSHELKTPIALIQGYAEGLKEGINDDEESRNFYCEVIMDEASKMNNMVKKLLTLNQLEFGNDAVIMERFDISALVQGVIQSASLLAQQKGARIIFTNTGSIDVWADEFKIEEVVTNYISNALNHVAGDMVIEIKINKLLSEKKVRVTVFNTGLPIPREDLDKIWIKFYKVDKARTREYGGSGIGLSIVKAIMDSMNQKCGVINYDNGVEFWFELEADETANSVSEQQEKEW